jgi:hypothetical protein
MYQEDDLFYLLSSQKAHLPGQQRLYGTHQGKQGQAGVPYEYHFACNISRPVNDFFIISPLRRRPVYTLYTISSIFLRSRLITIQDIMP